VALRELSRREILQAVAEYDRLGQDRFLASAAPDWGKWRSNGSERDHEVVDQVQAAPDVMHRIAQDLLQNALKDTPENSSKFQDNDDGSVLEGRYLWRFHAERERNPGLRRKKIRSVLHRGDPLACEACPTDPMPGGSRPIAVAIRHCQVWFTEESGHHFGVLDPGTGKITEHPISRPSDELASLAFDRVGTLWLEFKGPNGNDTIGRVGAGIKVRLFPIPTRSAELHRIISEPGGNMWFTEMNEDKVGYITTG
jgi:hypothetical protein